MRALFLLVVVAVLPTFAQASPYNAHIDNAARKHGVDPLVLRAITQIESEKNPWSFNSDGESFAFKSRAAAVEALYALNKNPWMLKIVGNDDRVYREHFRTQQAAQATYSLIVGSKPEWRNLVLRTDNQKEVRTGQARIRKLWMLNTDIGIAQINYRFHGKNLPVQMWFDYQFNLNYAAQLLAEHKEITGSDIEAAGRYHSKTTRHKKAYMAKLLPAYEREKRNAQNTLAIR